MPLAARGRPGHERIAEPSYLLRRGVALARLQLWGGRYKPVTRVLFPDGAIYYFGTWQPELAQALRGIPGVVLVDAPAFLDEYLSKMAALSAATVKEDLGSFFIPYYFAVTDDPVRRAKFEQRIASRE
jgi:hypothetical protein